MYYLAALVLCFGFLCLIMQLWSADLTIPFAYSGDAIFHGAVIKGAIDNGWYLSNPYTGMPFGSNLCDFPINWNFDVSIIKMLSLFSPNWALVMNLYFY